MFNQAAHFLKGSDFLKSLISTFGIVLPILIGLGLDVLPYFLSIAIGVLLTASSDVPGSRKHRTIGILTAAAIAMVVYLSISFTAAHLYWLLPVMAVLVFAISFIAVYGFRASLISFSGLLAIAITFAHKQSGADILINGLLIGAGGLWYLLLSVIFHSLLQKRQIENLLTDCLGFTARYIEIRGMLANDSREEEKLKAELYDLQVKINAIHETLRELLLTERLNYGLSNYKRKQLLIFIELIDILELSLANPVNYQKTKEIFPGSQNVLQPFVRLNLELSERLSGLALCMQNGTPFRVGKDLQPVIDECLKSIQDYVDAVKLPQAREGALLLHNLLDYEEKLLQKIQSIERVFQDLEGQHKPRLQNLASKQFITHQDYDIHILKENFNIQSPIFKHAARLVVAMLLGYVLGIIFSIQNAYWILLTIAVIMRPGYTLTKERSRERLYGTVIGAAIAVVVVLISQNPYVYGVLSVISLVLAFSFIQKNYRVSSIFVTTAIIFVYVLIKPDAFAVIQYRVIDTLTGALIAMGSILYLWPSWEYLNIKNVIIQALKANRNYLEKIDHYYHKQEQDATPYKLARKEAFLEMGNLNAVFQRMSQEPKSRQQHANKLYEIVGLNHTFLAAAAALGAFIKNNKSGVVSRHFDLIIKSIDSNLGQALQTLQHENLEEGVKGGELIEAYGYLEAKFAELVAIRNHELEKEYKPIDPALRKSLQEARLISDQLKWLVSISGSLKKAVQELENQDLRLQEKMAHA